MKYDMYLGREYGVLPRWFQFIIFIHQGLFRGGSNRWHWSKLKRIRCFRNDHRDLFHHTLIDRIDCRICGEQWKQQNSPKGSHIGSDEKSG